jgi:Mlc titration factor MtfA (ptsG expression regulator)
MADSDEKFPDSWLDMLPRALPCYPRLPAEHRRALRQCIQIFLAEKEFLGLDGLVITEEIELAIAAPACLLVLGIPHLGVYPRLREIIVRQEGFGDDVDAIGPDGTHYLIPQLAAGQAWLRGPVILAWSSVTRSVAQPDDGYNVVLHEFAHVLDMQDAMAGGTPPLESEAQEAAWTRVFTAEYKALVRAIGRGQPTLLHPYAATNAAEFFAVATEHFFEQPRELKRRHAELYAQLSQFYNQDPARWRPAPAKARGS